LTIFGNGFTLITALNMVPLHLSVIGVILYVAVAALFVLLINV
jgi:hypothetical protein